MIKELTDVDFFQEVEKSPVPYLVYFWAIWSPNCVTITRFLEEIDKKYDKLNVGKVNVDNEIKITNEYDIQNIPTILLFENGVVKERIVGTITKEVLLKKLNKYLEIKNKKKRRKND